jgi:hypothetical protein
MYTAKGRKKDQYGRNKYETIDSLSILLVCLLNPLLLLT